MVESLLPHWHWNAATIATSATVGAFVLSVVVFVTVRVDRRRPIKTSRWKPPDTPNMALWPRAPFAVGTTEPLCRAVLRIYNGSPVVQTVTVDAKKSKWLFPWWLGLRLAPGSFTLKPGEGGMFGLWVLVPDADSWVHRIPQHGFFKGTYFIHLKAKTGTGKRVRHLGRVRLAKYPQDS